MSLPDRFGGGDPRCHRSTNSYAALLANDYFAGNVDLRACSGAVMANVASIDGSPYIAQTSDEKDPPQINALSANTSFVTISIGGNDAGFANIFAYCLEYHDDCVSHFAGTIDLNSIETKLVSLYEQIKEDAPNATIVVVGYPQILPDAEAGDNYSCWDFLQTPIGNLGLDAASITWLRSLYDEGDKMIQAAAAEAGVNYANVEYAFNGHLSVLQSLRQTGSHGLSQRAMDHLEASPRRTIWFKLLIPTRSGTAWRSRSLPSSSGPVILVRHQLVLLTGHRERQRSARRF